jgi:hypothetical protein
MCFHFFFRHLDFFEMLRHEDESELARKYETVSLNPLIRVVLVVENGLFGGLKLTFLVHVPILPLVLFSSQYKTEMFDSKLNLITSFPGSH